MTFDQELASKGKVRGTKVEFVQRPDGSFATVSRQVIVKLPKDAGPAWKPVKMAKPKIKRQRAPKGQPTKQQRAVELLKSNSNLPRDKMIELFMNELNMSKAGATTYMYNAIKLV